MSNFSFCLSSRTPAPFQRPALVSELSLDMALAENAPPPPGPPDGYRLLLTSSHVTRRDSMGPPSYAMPASFSVGMPASHSAFGMSPDDYAPSSMNNQGSDYSPAFASPSESYNQPNSSHQLPPPSLIDAYLPGLDYSSQPPPPISDFAPPPISDFAPPLEEILLSPPALQQVIHFLPQNLHLLFRTLVIKNYQKA